jgi:hypothetical protein
MYSSPPTAGALMMEEYWAPSASSPRASKALLLFPAGTLAFQISSPVSFFSATMVASFPPGVARTRSPSTSGDSA